jgi:hypothetical protein
MFTFIRRLQQKPEGKRRAIALWTALCITILIFIMWLVSFFGQLGDVSAPVPAEKAVSPVQSLSEMLSSFSTLIRERF